MSPEIIDQPLVLHEFIDNKFYSSYIMQLLEFINYFQLLYKTKDSQTKKMFAVGLPFFDVKIKQITKKKKLYFCFIVKNTA